ncbi:serine hydrolase [Phytoactinopolyspora mesophila]|uniref:Serine hydrolase n=1 Tax=Phytoactinopolyspora mesophila TaxID=2650750 RepID=A0A7K3M7H9_9ACTN|nr:serine hydrolase [Phytoactinopolyspora mesophila]NDL58892.1 serine hydrolase [Phytoactinopolyspora mesophila]
MKRRMREEDLFALEIPAQPAISPDGSTVVYVLRTADLDADENRAALWRVTAATAQPRQLTYGAADSSPTWSPDGQTIAFLRAAGGPSQVWLLAADGGEPRQLTSLPGGAGAPVWSPDGTRIAFTAAVDTWAGPGEDDDARTRRASAPIVADRLGYRSDGAGLLRGARQHVHVVDVATDQTRQLTRGDWHAGPPEWSPDGTRLAFPAAKSADADRTGVSAVYVIDVEAADPVPVRAGDYDGLAGPVTWTPDGDHLLVVGRQDVSVGHNMLLRVPLDGGPVVDLAAGLDRNVMPGGPGYPGGLPQISADGRRVVFCVQDRGCTHVYMVELTGGAPRLLVGDAGRVVSGLSVASDADRVAVIVASRDTYGEVSVVDLDAGDETVVTAHMTVELDLITPEERVFMVSDGTEVHGWLIRDPGAPAPGPLLVDVHGGPHNAWSPAPDPGHAYQQLLAARGWSVLLLNPRGSDGYGEAFFTAAVGAWGVGDQRDFLEPVEQLVTDGIADPDRLALSGYSYGGYMTCWLTAQTDRFAAAVAAGVVSDLASMAGTSDVGPLFIDLELGSLPYRDPDRLAGQSPYTYVSQVSTPTLILHGLADDRCPVGQAELWFAALRNRGVPSELVLYPEASHLFILEGRPSHRLDYSQRLVDWVTRHTVKESLMTAAPLDRDHWQHRLAELAEKYKVPGATLGIASGEHTVEVAYGVTNVDTGIEVTTDTLFQIGSITKVWTASAVMALADAGKLDLDEPVVTYLPELRLVDADVTAKVTMRHLLTHTSGIDGDFFHDTGRGDECLERYVDALSSLQHNHPLSATWSYCNAGFTLAGRVIEKLTGQVWDAAMKDLLYTPLGLDHTVTLPEDALLHRSAVGHVHQGDEAPRRAPVWGLPRSGGPAGLIASTVGDVLAFARMHLSGGLAADGTRVLAAESVASMQANEVNLPDPYTVADSWGLSWFRLDWNGTRLVGHDGNTIGQSAFLRILPEAGLAVTLLTNGGHTRDLYESLVREVFRDLAGVEMVTPLAPPADPVPVDITPYLGTYKRTLVTMDVFAGSDGPRMRMTVDQTSLGLDEEVKEYDLVPVREDLFVLRQPGAETWTPVTFYTLDDGRPYMHFGARATPKVA